MKYLKYFETESAYSDFKASEDYITPNVSFVENEGVSYNPLVLITCKVGNNQYQAREGMTWRQWVDSEYNVDNFEIRFGKLCPYSAGLPEYFYVRNFDSKVPAVNPNVIVMDTASNFSTVKVSVNIQSDFGGPQVEMKTFIEAPWEQIVNDKSCPLNWVIHNGYLAEKNVLHTQAGLQTEYKYFYTNSQYTTPVSGSDIPKNYSNIYFDDRTLVS